MLQKHFAKNVVKMHVANKCWKSTLQRNVVKMYFANECYKNYMWK